MILQIRQSDGTRAGNDRKARELTSRTRQQEAQVAKRVIAVVLGGLLVLFLIIPGSSQDPDEAEMARLRNLGRSHYEEENLQQALDYFNQALELNPDSSFDHINAGITLVMLERYEEAKKHLDRGEELNPRLVPHAAFNRGIAYKRQRQFAESARELEKVREIDPTCPDTAYNLAVVYEGQGRLEEAFEEITRAVELMPYEISPHYRRLMIAVRLGKTDVVEKQRTTLNELRALDARTRTAEELETSIYTEIVEPDRPARLVDDADAALNPLGVRFIDITEKSGIPQASNLSVTAKTPFFWTDIDGDQNLDLVLIRGASGSDLELWRNQGNGQFQNWADQSGLSEPLMSGILAAVSADFNHDGHKDLCLSRQDGLSVLMNDGSGKFNPVANGRPFAVSSSEIAVTDYDHDGDLDLYLAVADGPPRMFSNDGQGNFTEVPKESGLQGAGNPVAVIRPIDFDDDNDTDFFLAHPEHPAQLLSNMRTGRFQDVAGRLGIGERFPLRNVVVGDINNDLWLDLVLLLDDGQIVAFLGTRSGQFQREVIGRVNNRSSALALIDYDNSGREDIFAAGHLFQNDGGFRDVTTAVGLKLPEPDRLIHAAAADIDGDGDEDLALAWNDGRVALLENQGGNRNNWIRVSLNGRQSNRFGVSTKVEVRESAFFQRKIADGLPVLMGIGSRSSVDVLRMWWPTGVAQNILSPQIGQTTQVEEKLGPPSSCPYVYIWDGEKFTFLTDVLDGTAIGVHLGNGEFWPNRNKEDLLIPGSKWRSKDGRLLLQLTGELREVVYVDQARLLAVDRLPDVEVHPDEPIGLPGDDRTTLHYVTDLRPPAQALGADGGDVTSLLQTIDGRYVRDFERTRFNGLAETHSLQIDFGDTSHYRKPALVLTGWIEWMDGDTLYHLGQRDGFEVVGPKLEVLNSRGQWETVTAYTGVPAGIGKSLVVPLPEGVTGSKTRFRLSTNMEIYWDRIVMGDLEAPGPGKVRVIDPRQADLRFRGFSEIARGERGQPPWFNYQEVSLTAPWQPQRGLLTRYGDVLPLLSKTDDKLVVFGPGDQVTLAFPAPPDPPAGWVRDYVLRLDGWIKDGNASSFTGDQVDPLPHGTMKGYPFGAERELDQEYVEYLLEYNTRSLRPLQP
jgi:Flp pilus assembly protein TadD